MTVAGGDREQVFSHPDDPYTTTIRHDDTGIHIIVEADVLAGGDPSDVEAECRRRGDLYRQMIEDMLKPKDLPPKTGGFRP